MSDKTVSKLEYHNDTYKRHAKIRRVIDGDTVDVEVDLGFHVHTRQRLRLLRVNTPEVRGKEREEGLEYKAFVEERLPVGSRVLVQSHKTGKYGRYLAEIWYQEDWPEVRRPLLYRNLNEELLEKLGSSTMFST